MAINESSIKGKFDEIAGKVKQTFGEGTNNNTMANEGAAQEVKGHTEQAWGSVKGAASHTRSIEEERATADGHDAREKATSAAEALKEKVEAGVDHLRGR